MAQPLSLKVLADRALIEHQFTDRSNDLASYLPSARRRRDDDFEDAHALLAAVLSMAGIPLQWPYEREDWDEKHGPPDAKERIAKMFGKRKRPAAEGRALR